MQKIERIRRVQCSFTCMSTSLLDKVNSNEYAFDVTYDSFYRRCVYRRRNVMFSLRILDGIQTLLIFRYRSTKKILLATNTALI